MVRPGRWGIRRTHARMSSPTSGWRWRFAPSLNLRTSCTGRRGPKGGGSVAPDGQPPNEVGQRLVEWTNALREHANRSHVGSGGVSVAVRLLHAEVQERPGVQGEEPGSVERVRQLPLMTLAGSNSRR